MLISLRALLAFQFLLLWVLPAAAEPPEEVSVSRLLERLQESPRYRSRLECLSVLVEGSTVTYDLLVVRERHGGPCPGDPSTAPIVDRLRVTRSTDAIEIYDISGDTWSPF